MFIENGLTARETLEVVYTSLVEHSTQEISLLRDGNPTSRLYEGEAYGTYESRRSHMNHSLAHVIVINDKEWITSLGTPDEHQKGRLTGDILVLETDKRDAEEVAEEIHGASQLYGSILFSNKNHTLGIHSGHSDAYGRIGKFGNLTSMVFDSRKFVHGEDHLKIAELRPPKSYVPAWVAPDPRERTVKPGEKSTKLIRKVDDIVRSGRLYSNITVSQIVHDLRTVLNFYSDGTYDHPVDVGTNALFEELEALRSHFGVKVVDEIAKFKRQHKQKLEQTIHHFMLEMTQDKDPDLFDQVRETVFSK